MAAITLVPADIRPQQGAIIIRMKSAAAVTNIVGMAVDVDSNGKAVAADADAAATAHVRGIVVAVGVNGAVNAKADDMLDIVTHGPVYMGKGKVTAGAVMYNSVTPGAIDETKSATQGDFPSVIGYNISDSVLYVDPQSNEPVVVP